MHLPFVHLDPISSNPRIRAESLKQLKEAIEKAREINANYAVIHARTKVNLDNKKSFKNMERCNRGTSRSRKEHGILVTLENADMLFKLSEVVKLTREINSKWLKITLDVGHAHVRRVSLAPSYPIKNLVLRGLDIFLPWFITKKNMPYEEYCSLENFIKLERDLIAELNLKNHYEEFKENYKNS